MLSSLLILSVVNEVFSPLHNFLYSARCCDTHRPRAVFSLNLVGTWQLPNLALYWRSWSWVFEIWWNYRRKKSRQKGIRHDQRGSFLKFKFTLPSWIKAMQKWLTYFLFHPFCPLRWAQVNPMLCSRLSLSSVIADVFSSSRFLCSWRC